MNVPPQADRSCVPEVIAKPVGPVNHAVAVCLDLMSAFARDIKEVFSFSP